MIDILKRQVRVDAVLILMLLGLIPWTTPGTRHIAFQHKVDRSVLPRVTPERDGRR